MVVGLYGITDRGGAWCSPTPEIKKKAFVPPGALALSSASSTAAPWGRWRSRVTDRDGTV
jgi:hypothetical protein